MKNRNSCDNDGQNMLHAVNIRHGSVDVEISHRENTVRSLSPRRDSNSESCSYALIYLRPLQRIQSIVAD